MSAQEECSRPQRVRKWLLRLQDRICEGLVAQDGAARMREDEWQREGGGGGRTRIIDEGRIFERAGVNFSHIHGDTLPPAATAARPELAGCAFQALGVSVVVHPLNPHIPTSHCNVRYFEAEGAGAAEPVWWFGGGFDLTPFYPVEADIRSWHRAAADICSGYAPDAYSRFKAWCDRYFHLPHRGEARGVGGIFFDDLNEGGFEACERFARAVGSGYLEAYLSIVRLRRDRPWTQRERDFQLMRRGRYVEFNLVHDRGTLFGLQSGGRTESILMSLPPMARWVYDFTPLAGSPEEDLIENYLIPRDWL
ncbi:MAG: oxygen-dependent coproporphyrinogen oxidase [Ectothiorhodospiraceae bacterium AqS1]|nr:oxygen-dependent coproporphyrinogen oxidase [Ectothiorhodospiraceae bacterium AqS1]|eukprot:XP_019861432.1 PREDICTED: uncharacterized protein LOC100639588 [Amphimedon queenslandica]